MMQDTTQDNEYVKQALLFVDKDGTIADSDMHLFQGFLASIKEKDDGCVTLAKVALELMRAGVFDDKNNVKKSLQTPTAKEVMSELFKCGEDLEANKIQYRDFAYLLFSISKESASYEEIKQFYQLTIDYGDNDRQEWWYQICYALKKDVMLDIDPDDRMYSDTLASAFVFALNNLVNAEGPLTERPAAGQRRFTQPQATNERYAGRFLKWCSRFAGQIFLSRLLLAARGLGINFFDLFYLTAENVEKTHANYQLDFYRLLKNIGYPREEAFFIVCSEDEALGVLLDMIESMNRHSDKTWFNAVVRIFLDKNDRQFIDAVLSTNNPAVINSILEILSLDQTGVHDDIFARLFNEQLKLDLSKRDYSNKISPFITSLATDQNRLKSILERIREMPDSHIVIAGVLFKFAAQKNVEMMVLFLDCISNDDFFGRILTAQLGKYGHNNILLHIVDPNGPYENGSKEPNILMFTRIMEKAELIDTSYLDTALMQKNDKEWDVREAIESFKEDYKILLNLLDKYEEEKKYASENLTGKCSVI